MGILLFIVMSALGIALTIGFWFGLAILFTLVLTPVYTDLGYVYNPDYSADYATWIMVLMLFFDRFFGPYGKALRKVCKYLPSGREAVTESYEYDR